MFQTFYSRRRTLFRLPAAAGSRWGGFRLMVFLLVFLFSVPAQAFDFSGWDALLKKYVSPKTIDGIRLHAVDYKKLKDDAGFQKIVTRLESAAMDDLKTRQDTLAFWINVYNILAVKKVLDHYPVDSIKDAGSLFRSVWKQPAGVVGGKKRTLHEIEHEILRPMGEPRIHAAIVCASVSCPDLRTEAFVPDRLDAQLEDQMKRFLQNRGKGMRVDRENNRLYLSSIFDWFEEDFEIRGGVLSFIAAYVPAADKKLLEQPRLKVSYLDYNWKVNDL